MKDSFHFNSLDECSVTSEAAEAASSSVEDADRRLLRSKYHQGLLKVSWKLIEAEIMKKKGERD